METEKVEWSKMCSCW